MKDGRTPLDMALVQYQENVIHLLLCYGATLDDADTNPLEISVYKKTMSVLHHNETFPDEIVSQGEAAIAIYTSSCSEGTVVTVFLRVDVVGHDGVGKTSLKKSLILQEFDPDEPSMKGVVIDPRCQIIVREACDWTTHLTHQDHQKMYDRNVTAIMADKLNTPELKGQYLDSKRKEA